jgi:hypothetical protein
MMVSKCGSFNPTKKKRVLSVTPCFDLGVDVDVFYQKI